MRNYTCPKCRNTCRCGATPRTPGEIRVLAWIIGLIFFTLLGIWPGLAARTPNAAGVKQWGTNSWIAEGVYVGIIVVLIVAAIIGKANSPEIRDRERQD